MGTPMSKAEDADAFPRLSAMWSIAQASFPGSPGIDAGTIWRFSWLGDGKQELRTHRPSESRSLLCVANAILLMFLLPWLRCVAVIPFRANVVSNQNPFAVFRDVISLNISTGVRYKRTISYQQLSWLCVEACFIRRGPAMGRALGQFDSCLMLYKKYVALASAFWLPDCEQIVVANINLKKSTRI